MGKPEAVSSIQTSISHFSHQHPLQLLNLQTLGQIFPCSACNLNVSGSVYTCTNCNFVLHPKCYQLPQQIKHPFDQNHALILYPKPVYPEGLFCCDACGNQGAGFSYHCGPCGIDLHTTCASLPLKLTHQCHHDQLSLTFTSPYPGNSFSCDICKRVSSKTWIYRCASCEFDVHLTCVATLIPAPLTRQHHIIGSISAIPPQHSNIMNSPNVAAYGVPRPPPAVMGQTQNQFGETPHPTGLPQMNSMAYNNVNQPGSYGAAKPANGLRDQLMVEAVNGIANGVAQSTTQAILQGFFSGGGGGDVSHVDVMGMQGSGGATMDGSYYDGGSGGGMDGGYSGGDGSYN